MPVRENIRRLIFEKGYKSVRSFAKAHEIDYVYLNALLNNSRRLNETMLDKISKGLGKPIYALYADVPVVPFPEAEPALKHRAAVAIGEAEAYESVRLYPDPFILGPGVELHEISTTEFAPILKRLLPRGFSSEPDRIVAFKTTGVSMRPTINSDSIIWVDRLDIVPKEGEIYLFLLADKTITPKRLVRLHKDYLIIDGDNHDPDERRCGSLKEYPMTIRLTEGDDDAYPIRGRVIWALNRFIEKPKE